MAKRAPRLIFSEEERAVPALEKVIRKADKAADMLEKGAAAVVCDRDLGLGAKQIIVSDTRKFYGLLVAEWFDHPEKELILVGVTGTNGKTTMTTMIHHIITCAGGKAGLIGTAGTLCGKEPMKRDDSTPNHSQGL